METKIKDNESGHKNTSITKLSQLQMEILLTLYLNDGNMFQKDLSWEIAKINKAYVSDRIKNFREFALTHGISLDEPKVQIILSYLSKKRNILSDSCRAAVVRSLSRLEKKGLIIRTVRELRYRTLSSKLKIELRKTVELTSLGASVTEVIYSVIERNIELVKLTGDS